MNVNVADVRNAMVYGVKKRIAFRALLRHNREHSRCCAARSAVTRRKTTLFALCCETHSARANECARREDGWVVFGALLKRHAVFPLDDVPIKRKIDGETCCKKLATRRRLPKELRPRV